MAEEGEMWKDYKKHQQEKRWKNNEQSLKILRDKGIMVTILNEDQAHYRIKGFNFWATTGKFYNPHTGEKGRGVMNLLKVIEK